MVDFMFTQKTTFKGKFVILFSVIFLLLAIGTVVYHVAEGWSYVDSFYFASISLSSRGYGELHPTTTFTKIFTVFYLFLGVAFVLYSLSSLIGNYMQNYEPAITQKVDKIMKKVSGEPKKDKWVILKAPAKPEQNFKPKMKF